MPTPFVEFRSADFSEFDQNVSLPEFGGIGIPDLSSPSMSIIAAPDAGNSLFLAADSRPIKPASVEMEPGTVVVFGYVHLVAGVVLNSVVAGSGPDIAAILGCIMILTGSAIALLKP